MESFVKHKNIGKFTDIGVWCRRLLASLSFSLGTEVDPKNYHEGKNGEEVQEGAGASDVARREDVERGSFVADQEHEVCS